MKDIVVTGTIAAVGLRVVKGLNWSYGAQDMQDYLGSISPKATGVGTIEMVNYPYAGWVKVKWDGGYKTCYRAGFQSRYDLHMYIPDGVVEEQKIPGKVSLDEARKALQGTIVKGESYDEYEIERGYDIYGKSLKPNKYDNRNTDYPGNCLYLPPKVITLQRGERFEGRRLHS